jgi:hypothetical protein
VARARAQAKARARAAARARARAKAIAAARARALVAANARERLNRPGIELGGLPAPGDTFVATGVSTFETEESVPVAAPAAPVVRERSQALPAALAGVVGLALFLLIAAGLPEAALRPLGSTVIARRSYVAALGAVTLGAAVIGLAVTFYGV